MFTAAKWDKLQREHQSWEKISYHFARNLAQAHGGW